jgi:type II secretory pathway component GspD/PulD (secretin)
MGLRLLITLLILCNASAAWARTEFKMITLQHRFAQELVPIVAPLVGEDGNASAIDNHLVIRASPERMQAIEELVAKLDTARRNMRITVSHEDMQTGKQQTIGASGNVRIGQGRVIVQRRMPGDLPPENNVNIDLDQREYSQSRQGSEFVNVTDGERAFIRVGQRVPYTQQWAVLTQSYAQRIRHTEFQDITTGFAVRPRSLGDQVEVEITPRIAQMGAGGVIDFEELSTVVMVRPGEWLDIGGIMQSRDDVSRAILNSQSASGSGDSRLMIRVD